VLNFGERNGGVGTWGLTFNPVLRLARTRSHIEPYVTAGYGLYHRNLTLSQPTIVPTLVFTAHGSDMSYVPVTFAHVGE